MLAFVRRRSWWIGGALAAASAWACSLNPQPLPPGDNGPDASLNEQSDAGTTAAGADSGAAGFGGGDAGRASDSGTGPAAPTDAAADGHSAESDGGTGGEDGASDAPAEASTDGAMEGG
jgi:hypothetical protein